jgi:triosephosphate isomerase (TIM)
MTNPKSQNPPVAKKFFVGFNWKMNPNSLFEAKNLFDTYTSISNNKPAKLPTNFCSVVFVPSLYLTFLQNHNPSKILLGSQDISDQEIGAHTGQIAGSMLNSIDCEWTLVGHSESRRDFKMKDKIIKYKLIQAINNNIVPVLCLSFNHLDSAKTELLLKLEATFTDDLLEIIKAKAKANFGVKQQPIFVIALEPIANIGTGQHLNPTKINDLLKYIDQFLNSRNLHKGTDGITGDWIGDYIAIYGGSVNAQNLLEIGSCPAVDGFLIGGASLDKRQIAEILGLMD